MKRITPRTSVAFTSGKVIDAALAYRALYLKGSEPQPVKWKRDAMHTAIDRARQHLHDAIDALIAAQELLGEHLADHRKRSSAAKRGHKRARANFTTTATKAG